MKEPTIIIVQPPNDYSELHEKMQEPSNASKQAFITSKLILQEVQSDIELISMDENIDMQYIQAKIQSVIDQM